MTCIVGLIDSNKVYIGGDSAAAANWDMLKTAQPKVFRLGELLIGYTSSFRMGQLLQYELGIPPQAEDQDDYAYLVTALVEQARALFAEKGYLFTENGREKGGEFLVGYRGKLYVVQGDFSVMAYQDTFAAVGCGAAYAMGALQVTGELPPKKRLKLALKVAAHFSNGVSGPFHILKV